MPEEILRLTDPAEILALYHGRGGIFAVTGRYDSVFQD